MTTPSSATPLTALMFAWWRTARVAAAEAAGADATSSAATAPAVASKAVAGKAAVGKAAAGKAAVGKAAAGKAAAGKAAVGKAAAEADDEDDDRSAKVEVVWEWRNGKEWIEFEAPDASLLEAK